MKESDLTKEGIILGIEDNELNAIIAKDEEQYHKVRMWGERLQIIVTVLMAIAFILFIIEGFRAIVTEGIRPDLQKIQEQVDQIERENVYRDEVINQTRAELNY